MILLAFRFIRDLNGTEFKLFEGGYRNYYR